MRAELLRWLVLVHEGLGCWSALAAACDVFFYLVREPLHCADASFALLRTCGEHDLPNWRYKQLCRLVPSVEPQQPALWALLQLQWTRRQRTCDLRARVAR